MQYVRAENKAHEQNSDRTKFIPEGQEYVHSDTFGTVQTQRSSCLVAVFEKTKNYTTSCPGRRGSMAVRQEVLADSGMDIVRRKSPRCFGIVASLLADRWRGWL